MNENAENAIVASPQAAEEREAAVTEATTPEETAQEILIPVKFNKEIKKLTAPEAAGLAQKGMKFEMIADDYERIKRLAGNGGQSIAEFLAALEERQNEEKKKELTEKCGGNAEIAEHIMELERGSVSTNSGFDELQAQFPEIKDISELPAEVLERAETKGTALLDEFLRYRLRSERTARNAARKQQSLGTTSVGSQREFSGPDNPEQTEFLRGLWNR